MKNGPVSKGIRAGRNRHGLNMMCADVKDSCRRGFNSHLALEQGGKNNV